MVIEHEQWRLWPSDDVRMYDIFTRHCFGNFFDAMKEMSFNPVMGEQFMFVLSSSMRYNWDTRICYCFRMRIMVSGVLLSLVYVVLWHEQIKSPLLAIEWGLFMLVLIIFYSVFFSISIPGREIMQL